MPKANQSIDDVRGLRLVQSRQHSEVLYFKQAKVKNCSLENRENTNFQEVIQSTGGLVFQNLMNFPLEEKGE